MTAPMPPAVWRTSGATVVDVRKLAAEALAVVLTDTPEQAIESHAHCLAILDRLHAAGWALTPLPDHLKGVL